MALSDKSKMTLGLAISFASFAFWIGTVHSETRTNTRDQERALGERLEERKQFIETVERVARMEGQIQFIYDATRARQRGRP